jgi:hypothetical protein
MEGRFGVGCLVLLGRLACLVLCVAAILGSAQITLDPPRLLSISVYVIAVVVLQPFTVSVGTGVDTS